MPHRRLDVRRIEPGVEVGNYLVERMIAEGAFGKTWLATHMLLGEDVCIKDCSNIEPRYASRLVEEVRIIWHLRHHSIPAVRELYELADGTYAMVMSFIPGETVEQLVERLGPIHPEDVCWITGRNLNGLWYLHMHGVVHGDEKPQNIIVHEPSHTVFMVDYGLALSKPKPNDGSLGYTECFSPPEAVRGDSLRAESDMYSLGMTMLFMLGGGMKYVEQRKVPPHVPKPLAAFVERLIALDMNDRPNWKQKVTPYEEIGRIRMEVYKRDITYMVPIRGIRLDYEEDGRTTRRRRS